ncbi:hypothetical protein KR215_010006 [Drosophila sulfurigaster]|nr:hypothetical protein KR215_010006 [Drosophila sulfurigaster]
MGNTQNQNRSALTSSSALEKSPATSGSLVRLPLVAELGENSGSGGNSRRSSRTRVLSRLVSQKRVRDAFLQAATTPSSTNGTRSTPTSPLAEWSTPEVEHGQLNANTEQMDFRKSISSSAQF